MSNAKELKAKFWEALHADRTLLLGATGVSPRPMTAIAEEDRAPLWFFTSRDSELVTALDGSRGRAGVGTFASKGHELFATIDGTLHLDTDHAVVERLWNPWVAAWYKGGKDDPTLRLLRFDAEHAEIWLNENSFFAGVKMLLGADPQRDYRDKVGEVSLSR